MVSITILGTSGSVGAPLLDILQTSSLFDNKIDFPIKAITTKDKSSESNDKLQYITGKITEDDLSKQLEGTDVLISLVKGSPEVFKGIESLISAIKPKLYIPAEFGAEYGKISQDAMHPGLVLSDDHAKRVRGLGVKTVKLFTSHFRAKPVFLEGFAAHVGIDVQNKVYSKVVGGNDVIQFSKLDDVSRVIGVLATASDYSALKDEYKVFSGEKSIPDALAYFESSFGPFTVKEIQIADIAEKFKAEKDAGEPDFITSLFYIWAEGKDHGLNFSENDRELINPQESLWKWGSWD